MASERYQMSFTALRPFSLPCAWPRTQKIVILYQVGPNEHAQAKKWGVGLKPSFMAGCLSRGGSIRSLGDICKSKKIFRLFATHSFINYILLTESTRKYFGNLIIVSQVYSTFLRSAVTDALVIGSLFSRQFSISKNKKVR